jgi:hypothetical protein
LHGVKNRFLRADTGNLVSLRVQQLLDSFHGNTPL